MRRRLWSLAFALVITLAVAQEANADPRGILQAEEISASPKMKAASMVWSKDRLFIADRGGNRIVAFHPPDRFETVREIKNPGGVAVDPRGHLVVTTREPNRVLRLHPDGDQDLAEGQVGTPHYLAIHRNGTLYWSGFPDGGTRSLSPEGKVTIHQPTIGHTFGIALSPRQDALFVTSKLPNLDRREVWRFPLNAEGQVQKKGEVFFKTHELQPRFKELPAAQDGKASLAGWIGRVQGLAIDGSGNIFVAGAEAHTSGSAVAVVDPSGQEVRAMILNVPRNISSLCLGGTDGRTLYITGAGEYRLYRVSLGK